MMFRRGLAVPASLGLLAFAAVAVGGCGTKENIDEVMASGGCPAQQLRDAKCTGATVATTDAELRATLDLWQYDLDEIRTRVPDLWNDHDDVVQMPDDGRIVVVFGVHEASDCEAIVYDWSLDAIEEGSVVNLSTARNGSCTNTDLALRSILLVLEAEPPIVGVAANGQPLPPVAPEAAAE